MTAHIHVVTAKESNPKIQITVSLDMVSLSVNTDRIIYFFNLTSNTTLLVRDVVALVVTNKLSEPY